MKEGLEFEFTANMKDFNKKVDQARDDIKGFKKRIESQEAVNLSLNLATLIKQINLAKVKLKAFKKEGDIESEIKITADIERLKQAKTQALRELRNFTRTGQKDVSVLGNLFGSVTDEIKKSRDALGTLGSKLKGLDKIEKEVKDITKAFKSGKISMEEYKAKLEQLRGKTVTAGKSFDGMKKAINGVGGAIVGLYALDRVKDLLLQTSQIARSFETAFVGVRKTINGSEQDYIEIENGLKRLSKQIPLTVEELAGIAEVGGQLGVAKKDIIEFTRVSAMLGATTVLSAEQASTSFAKIANVMQEPIGNIEYMGAALVDLGNNFETNEAEILSFSERISGAGAIVGLTIDDLLGISTAFTSVGIEAESGGTAVQKTLLKINRAVNDGGIELEKFATLSGQTAKEFSELWKADAGEGFLSFVNGLKDAGQDADQILADLIGTDVRLARAFLSVANAGDLLNDTMETSQDAYEDGTALAEEFEKRLNSNDSKLKIQNNRWRLWGETIGKDVTPALLKINELLLENLPKAFNLVILGIQIFIAFFTEKFLIAQQTVAGFVSGAKQKFNTFVGVLQDIGLNLGVLGRNAKETFRVLVANIGKAFKNIGDNGVVMADNLGESFKNVPFIIGESINFALDKIGSFLNQISDGVNNVLGPLLEKVGIGKLGAVKFDGIDTDSLKPVYKELKDLNDGFEEASYEAYKRTNRDIMASKNKELKSSLESYKNSKDKEIDINRKAIELAILETDKKNKDLEKLEEKAIEMREKELKKEMDKELQLAKDLLDKINDLDKGGGGAGASKKREELENQYQKQLDKTVDLIEKKAKINSDAYREIIKDIDKGIDGLGKYIDSIIKAKEEIREFKTDAVKNLRDINNELGELTEEKDQELGERRVEILEEQKEIQEKINELEQEGGTGKAGSEIVALEEKRIKLNEELELIKRNASESTLKEIENYSKLSEAEKIILENEKKRAEALERQKIYEQIKEGEMVNLDEIVNYKNLKLAEELNEKQAKLNNELKLEEAQFQAQKELLILQGEELKKFKESEAEEYRKMIDGKKDIEIEFTKFLGEEMKKRLKLESNIRETAGQLTPITGTTAQSTSIINNLEVKLDGLQVRSEADIVEIADKVYGKIEEETELANKNIY